MGYHPVTPFGRTVDAVLIQRQNQLQAASERMPAASSQLEAAKPVSKWNVLRDLAVARHHFGLSDRDLSVLQALLSFWSGTELPADRALVIHPSNQTICDRLNGMANSTMRRYLARLVDAGLLLRRDSPTASATPGATAAKRWPMGLTSRHCANAPARLKWRQRMCAPRNFA